MDVSATATPTDGPTAEPEQLTTLVREHYTPALHYAERILRNVTEAEDSVQEAFAEAFTSLHTLEDPGAAAAWIRSIVRHRCLRRLRRRDLQLVPFASDLEALSGAPSPFDGEPPEHRRDFAARLVARLPEHEREIVILFYLKECSQQEIAAFLGLPLSTVNNRLHDARQRMKKWETHMHERTNDSGAHEAGRVSRVGTVMRLEGPLVEARFDADAALDIFDAIAIVGSDGKPLEQMKICHRIGDGRVLCLLTERGADALAPGMTVLNTGKVGVDLTPLRHVPGVPPETLLASVDTLRGSATPSGLLPTGIKAIDLLCPLARGGVAIQVGMSGVGRVVLLDELGARLEHERSGLALLCLVERTEVDPYRGWDESTLRGSVGATRFYWALSDRATDPALPALDAADAVIYLSPLMALTGLYPAIDAEHSRSRLLEPEIVGERHSTLAQRSRDALLLCKRAEADPELLERLACRAFAAARRRHRELAAAVSAGSESSALGRARKLRSFLSQPFGAATELTGWPGIHVSLEDTLEGCRAILDGEVDDLPLDAFAYAGPLDEIRERARTGARRVHP